MTPRPLLVFDFDGVIIDGMDEYWSSARQACINLLGENSNAELLPKEAPKTFRELRPWVHKGWEMVLLAAEFTRPNSPLQLQGAQAFSKQYQTNCQEALKAWNWEPSHLQKELDNTRRHAINIDLKSWLSLHQPFPFVIDRLLQLDTEGLDLAVLTTKGEEFTAALLDSFKLKTKFLFGHESGNKAKVLLQLSKKQRIRGFIEDRRTTLETILEITELSSIPCYLASWGYLKPEDKQELPTGIHLLDAKKLSAPLASWD